MTAMEVMVLAVMAGSQLPLEFIASAAQCTCGLIWVQLSAASHSAILNYLALSALDTSIELLEHLPEPPLELQANQMVRIRIYQAPRNSAHLVAYG